MKTEITSTGMIKVFDDAGELRYCIASPGKRNSDKGQSHSSIGSDDSLSINSILPFLPLLLGAL